VDAAGNKSLADVSAEFSTEPLETAFPAALWGPRTQPDANAKPIPAVSEVKLRPKAPPQPGQTAKMRVSAVQYERTFIAVAETFTETLTTGPVPTVLPAADLKALGLVSQALAFAAFDPGQSQIELGGRPMGAAVA